MASVFWCCNCDGKIVRHNSVPGQIVWCERCRIPNVVPHLSATTEGDDLVYEPMMSHELSPIGSREHAGGLRPCLVR